MNTIVLEAALMDVRPPIWRRFALRDNSTLGDLHVVIRDSMGWSDEHLHAFRIGERLYGDPTMDDGASLGQLDESRARLRQVLPPVGKSFLYYYDFGDGWKMKVTVEKMLTDDPGPAPRCLAGRRAGPPEDCGGVGGYYDLVQVRACNPGDLTQDMRERLEWAGSWDPERFDPEELNRQIAE